MNIDSANLSSLSVHPAKDGVSPPLTGSELPASFADSFQEQLNSSSAVNNPGELPKPTQTIMNSFSLNELQSPADLLGEGGNMQMYAALFGNELPVSYKLTDDTDPETMSPVLTDTLIPANLVEITVAGYDAIPTDNAPDAVEIGAADEEQGLLLINEASVTKSPSFVMANKDDNSENKQVTNANDYASEITTALLTSVIAPVTASLIQDNSSSADLAAFKLQYAMLTMKNSSQNNDLDLASANSGDEASDHFLNKMADQLSLEPSKPSLNLNHFENADGFNENKLLDREFNLSGKKGLPTVITEVGQLRHMIDSRVAAPMLTKPISHPDWSQDLGERILWMSNRLVPAAEIKLNPQHLGPISIRVDINQDQASISFAAQHGSVREALEASIPKLRDMMGAQQLNLIDVNVSQHFSSEQGRPQPQNFAQMAAAPGQNIADGQPEAMEEFDDGRAVMTKGLLSIYA